MGFWGWCADAILGKVDENVIYDGMRGLGRRNPLDRRRFVEGKKSQYASAFNDHVAKSGNDWNNAEAQIQKYRLLILSKLYDEGHDKLYYKDSGLQARVFEACFGWMNTSNDVTNDKWKETINRLKADKVVSALLPKLFTDEFSQDWNRFKSAKIERKKALETELKDAEANLSRMKSIFYSMDAGMSRTQMVVSIDATEQYISRLKSALS